MTGFAQEKTLQKDPQTGKVSPWHFFDNNADRLQMNNLCNDLKYTHVQKQLATAIRKHLHWVGETQWLNDSPKDRSEFPGIYRISLGKNNQIGKNE